LEDDWFGDDTTTPPPPVKQHHEDDEDDDDIPGNPMVTRDEDVAAVEYYQDQRQQQEQQHQSPETVLAIPDNEPPSDDDDVGYTPLYHASPAFKSELTDVWGNTTIQSDSEDEDNLIRPDYSTPPPFTGYEEIGGTDNPWSTSQEDPLQQEDQVRMRTHSKEH
jgi:hypothetical protein